ncbi:MULTISPECIES: hypothetical protein [Sinorhizobium]|uniref:hypothetical protein n=1 Tax=Sinorhizobium TaxID=28105 RepID=UPI0004816E68|nr:MULTISPECIES: hypothetical protein [Sinorhizobium]WOS67075.1 hypothetical protein SFGR64A_30215 [Sinorhizobium fredii GR64]
MDAGALAAAKQSLEVLKSTPMWVLLGLCAILALIWWSPQFSQQLPPSLLPALPLTLFVTATLTIFKLASTVITAWLSHRSVAEARDLARLENLYRPLITLFLTRHVVTSKGVGAPRLRHRLSNAWMELGAYRSRWVGLKRACRALSDPQVSMSAEVEFGGDFPLSQILDLVRDNSSHASFELIRLVNRADRSRYEEPDFSLLTDEELALFTHIDSEHRRLSSKFK